MSYIPFDLPPEINDYIKSFLELKCCECHCIYYDDKCIMKNITTIYVNQYFNDDYLFPQYHKIYKMLCITCKDKLRQKGIETL